MEFFNVVDGQRRASDNHHQCTNPRTEEPLWDAPVATVHDLEDAITAAQKAFQTWSKTTVKERADYLRKIVDVYIAHKEELMEIIMKETGKSSLMAEIEIGNTCEQTTYYTKVHLEDEVTFEDEKLKIVATHHPLGIVGAICPWNFPLILSNIKVVSSLITGNCIIVKPSPFAPYSVMKSVELLIDVLPPGVVQVVNGGTDLGVAMTLHPAIAKISFTGTIATGKSIMANCAKTLKRLTLELAGNDAAIVTDDIDVAKVAGQVATGCFFNAGQVCVAAKRVYVHESVYGDFLEKFAGEVKKSFSINNDAKSPSLFGPVSNKTQYDAVRDIARHYRKHGSNIIAAELPLDSKGFWIPPTIVIKPPEDSVLVQEEQFGPIVPILTWTDEEDVLRHANLRNAGLGASVYCRDIGRAESIARRLEAGTVAINVPELPHPGGYFAGMKDSGHGGEMGKQGLSSYCYTKCLQFAKG
ncbi:aldehyde dehydrogenase [Colletotrichum graminicola]|uniref:aldehyde dehydrogenase (NAD(+)) n=1 Tax=Colletotrichum graminicola (strain M1.001 / M2 / FGSC 10212) TaxID=645133 RepID=E3QVB2_COLGM|nr:aldehyde dehydrogenase [Colletotrichum graminicola M1.001]EFQ34800.1 aldehyde dehydrogenase [Colletotrichum graminicola M1.001]WDK10407.1 aldehyde dehydrogenase [Colletotrichum graminicola]